MSAVRLCGWCVRRFKPTVRQLGQMKRGRKAYCSDACAGAANRAKMSKWWRSPEGRAYARSRNQEAAR